MFSKQKRTFYKETQQQVHEAKIIFRGGLDGMHASTSLCSTRCCKSQYQSNGNGQIL